LHMKTNEYGKPLDRNGYAESIFPLAEDYCVLCTRRGTMVRHEVYHGPLRDKSKRLGCWVHLCPECHYKLHNVESWMDKALKREMQKEAMWYYKWDVRRFRSEFGKNYLEELDE